ncbi:hypothetical protein F0562_006565 [Nyssa sinensis]|uniref:Uncharacterized protein n=1 Tax=Nyssa sinensis TaxID=561372 RepID=A0A5J5ANC4_9ASTE|nr:hypothetical protein F0562_006565 [Nyssa sinensis]
MAMKVILHVAMFLSLILVHSAVASGHDYDRISNREQFREEDVSVPAKKEGSMQGEDASHNFRQHRKDIKMKDMYHENLNARTDDTRPTGPGHSPGVGHLEVVVKTPPVVRDPAMVEASRTEVGCLLLS